MTEPADAKPAGSGAGPSSHLLIIEDDDAIARFLAASLTAAGYRTQLCASVAQANAAVSARNKRASSRNAWLLLAALALAMAALACLACWPNANMSSGMVWAIMD